MTDEIHYLPVGLGIDHVVRPLVRDFDPDRAVLLTPATEAPQSGLGPAGAAFLRETIGIDVEVSEIDTEEFASVVAKAYDDLCDNLAVGNEVRINVASPHWSIGAGYATAAHYLIADVEQAADDAPVPEITSPRDRLACYYTEPAGYHTDELLETVQHVRDFRGDFNDAWRVARKLQTDVESDKQTVASVIDLLEPQDGKGGGLDNLVEVLEAVGLDSADDDGIARGVEEVVTGIEAVTNGIDILATKQNREAINSLPFLGPMTDVTQGLAEISERPDSESDTVQPVDLLQYFAERLEKVHQVLQRIEYLHEDFEAHFEQSTDDGENVLSDAQARGLAHGVRTFGEQHHATVPGPLQFRVSPFKLALLYTLMDAGGAESIKGFTIRLIQQALETAAETDLSVPDRAGVDAIRNGEFDAATVLLDELLNSIQTKVQYNLRQLEEDGFVRKETFGQSTGIDLTQAGALYIHLQDCNRQWRETVFDDLCRTVRSICEANE
jgi:hypothetical protein